MAPFAPRRGSRRSTTATASSSASTSRPCWRRGTRRRRRRCRTLGSAGPRSSSSRSPEGTQIGGGGPVTLAARLLLAISSVPVAVHFWADPEARGVVLLIGAMVWWTLGGLPDYGGGV